MEELTRIFEENQSKEEIDRALLVVMQIGVELDRGNLDKIIALNDAKDAFTNALRGKEVSIWL